MWDVVHGCGVVGIAYGTLGAGCRLWGVGGGMWRVRIILGQNRCCTAPKAQIDFQTCPVCLHSKCMEFPTNFKNRNRQEERLCNALHRGRGIWWGRAFGAGNLAFQVGHQISHAKSRGFLLRPPIPLCLACSMPHSLFLASAKLTTAKLTRHQPPPPPVCQGRTPWAEVAFWIPPPPPGRGMPTAVRRPAVVRMPACHSRRFKGERPIGTATGEQSQPPRPCATPPPCK